MNTPQTAAGEPADHSPRRRSLLGRVDRRLLRSSLYSVVTLALVVIFKAGEWMFEHELPNNEHLALPIALGMAVLVAVVFQLWHKRLEEAVAHWINRAAHTREQQLVELAEELPLIQTAATLRQRVVERLDQIFAVYGSALYMLRTEARYACAASTSKALPPEVNADDPALIHAKLHGVVAPCDLGSLLPMSMLWPVTVRGAMTGFLALGTADRNETLDEFQRKAVAYVAQAVGNSLALLEGGGPPVGLPTLPDKPSIAVLPFENMSEHSAQEFFADGAVEDITAALAQYRWLFVIARNSTLTYKGRTIDVKQVGRELGVRYLVEGSVRRSGDQLRIAAQLIDATSGAHLWANRIEGPVQDLFALQDQVTSSVVGAIMPKLEQAEIRRVSTMATGSLGAYEQFLRGMDAIYRLEREYSDKAMSCFRAAIALDAAYAIAWARGAEAYSLRLSSGWMVNTPSEREDACSMARRAVGIGRDDATVTAVSGFVLAYVGGNLDFGGEYIRRSLSISDNVPEAWAYSAWLEGCLGNYETAIDHALRAMRLSPFDSRSFKWKMFASRALLFAGRYEEAAQWAEKSVADQPNFAAGLRVTAASHALAGHTDAARAALARLVACDPNICIANLKTSRAPDPTGRNTTIMLEGLRAAGLPEQR